MTRVHVVAASDAERDPERRLRWGDYWLKRNIERALEAQGWDVQAGIGHNTDVMVHCWGLPLDRVPEWTCNVLYIHSHPATLDRAPWALYDRVVVASEQLAKRLRAQGVRVDAVNTGATDFEPLDVPLTHDAVFVGNNRGGMRPIIAALGDLTTLPFKLEVWGEGWESLPDGIWQGPYIPYDELNALYSSSAVVLNDTHVDMIEAGIINPRVLDAQAAGAWVVEPSEDALREVTFNVAALKERRYPPIEYVGDCSYARLVHDLTDGITPPVRVDLGCGNHKREGFIGIDRVAAEGVDVVWDVCQGLPNADGTVDYVVADNLMEHIGTEFIAVMNDLHRVLKASGRLTVIVPGVHAPAAAYGDPTHVRHFVPETWDYFDHGHPRWRDYGQSYGIAPWKVLRREVRDRFIDVVLQPVKECQCES